MGRSVARAILEGIRKKQEELEKPKGSKLQEDSGLQMYATEPPGAMSEKDWITVEQMEEICSECAGNMRERNMTRIAMKEALECGLVEYVDQGQHQDQPAGELGEEKGEKWKPEKPLKKGRFSEYCRREGFEGPSKACAEKAMGSDDKSVRGMAGFYLARVHPGEGLNKKD